MEEPGNGVERRVAYESRFTRLEEQSKLLVADAESEKDTRRRVNLDIRGSFEKLNTRLDRIEEKINAIQNKLYWYSGAIAAFVFVIHWVFK
jgi:chromosome segregation ATPase